MANTPITAAQAKDFDIAKCLVYSNDEKTKVDISGLISDLYYFEDVLSPSIKVDLMFADTATVEKDDDLKTVIDALQMVGTEKVELKLKDPNEEEISVTVYSDFISAPAKQPRKSLVTINLVSKELIFNYKTAVNYRLDGLISDHVEKIMKDTIKTEKKLDIEKTIEPFNYSGVNLRPYATILTMARKAIPATANAKGNTAGFFFFETSEGFKFKSIDGLLSQKQKKSISYNDSSDREEVPAGYDIKALALSKDNRVDTKDKLEKGAFSTRTILFDPFNCYYEVVASDAKSKEQNLKLAGKELPKLNSEFDVAGLNKEFSRTTYYLLDTGTLPTGNTRQQIGKSQEVNFDVKNILNQSIMRYNQLYSSMITVTIAGDFSLHAGDVVYVDVPELSADTKNDQVSKQSGGLYIISDLCHYVTTKGTFTKLNLVRDSFGRTGNHTTNRS